MPKGIIGLPEQFRELKRRYFGGKKPAASPPASTPAPEVEQLANLK